MSETKNNYLRIIQDVVNLHATVLGPNLVMAVVQGVNGIDIDEKIQVTVADKQADLRMCLKDLASELFRLAPDTHRILVQGIEKKYHLNLEV